MARKPYREDAGRRMQPVGAALGAGRRGVFAGTAFAVLFLAVAAIAGDERAVAFVHSPEARRAVVGAALKSAVPPELALAVARAGVAFPRRSPEAGTAAGLMGIRPALARAEFGIRAYHLRETRANAGLGVALLERLYRRHGERWDLALSHYRGGPLGRCESGPVAHGDTLDYVADVMEWWRRYQEDETAAALIAAMRRGGTRSARREREQSVSAPHRMDGRPGAAPVRPSARFF